MILCGSNVDAFIAGYQVLKRKHGWFKGIADRKSKYLEYLRYKYGHNKSLVSMNMALSQAYYGFFRRAILS